MRSAATRTSVSALSLTVILALTGCGDGGSEDDSGTPGGPPTETAGADQGDDHQGDDQGGPDTGAALPSDVTQAALQAIATAEAEAGGTAYEIDDEDDDEAWEVGIAVDDRGVEVKVSADGTTVTGTDDDDDLNDERTGLQQAQVGIADAIETAIAEVGGTLDDAELSDDDGRYAWEVTVDADGDDDVEVYVDITSGEVLGVDRDD